MLRRRNAYTRDGCHSVAADASGCPGFAEQVPQSREQIELSFATVVKQTAPAVVNVYAKRVVRQPGIPGFSDDPFFRRFFGDGGAFGRSREMVQNSLGSGVLVDPSGIVVTNNHVIQGGTEVRSCCRIAASSMPR